MTKSVLILSFCDLKRDPRLMRQIHYFSQNGFRIAALGKKAPKQQNIEFLDCNRSSQDKVYFKSQRRALNFWFKRYDAYYWLLPHVVKSLGQLKTRAFDLIVANDILTLPLALRIKGPAKVLFDAHEYSPDETEDTDHNLFCHYLCSKYLPQIDAMTTVCSPIAREYENRFGVRCEVITNAPFYHNLQPTPSHDKQVRLLYHGVATRQRYIEDALSVIRLLDSRFSLNLLLMPGDQSYLQSLQNMMSNEPRVRFLPPVPQEEIVSFGNQYDLGLYSLRPTNTNLKFALPNKLFELIQSRLALAISPNPEMKAVVEKYGCGVVADDFEPSSLAKKIQALDAASIQTLKQRSHEAAADLNAEANFKKLDHILETLMR